VDIILAKGKPKSESNKKEKLEPIRIERKFIHGEWVEVKIYASHYKPDEFLRVNFNSKKKDYQKIIGIGEDF
jgi:hypothetical protein